MSANLPDAIDRMADAIVTAHADALALPVSEAAPAAPAAAPAVYRAALKAAAALGFGAADAACIAHAWQTRTERTHLFDARSWPDRAADFGLPPWPRAAAYAPCPHALGLYAVMPDAAWVGRMAVAGVPTLQLRFKSDDPAAVRAEVHNAVASVRGTAARLFINDHWQVAIEAGAYGVHLGQEDLDRITPGGLATIRDAGLRLGISSHGYAEMKRADALGPSYIALGAVFATTLKQMPTAPQGLGRLHAYARLLHDRPLVAIGGIDADRLAAVLACGVGSVGVVRALLAAANPDTTAAAWTARIAAATGAARY